MVEQPGQKAEDINEIQGASLEQTGNLSDLQENIRGEVAQELSPEEATKIIAAKDIEITNVRQLLSESQSREAEERKAKEEAQQEITRLQGENGFLIETLKQTSAESDKKDKIIAEKEKLAGTDKLTGLNNRHKLDEKLNELRKLRAENCQIAIIDIDKFKNFNDTYGHLNGDRALTTFADTFKRSASVEEHDMIGRWGGEEFCIIMPDTDSEKAIFKLDMLRQEIENTEIELDNGEKQKITISVGISDGVFEHNIRTADEALYQSKEEGRNRVNFLKSEQIN